ncbi:hypothetical protein BURPS668_A2988 [Burkholderia pseudomallei 668]|nr:hypothetical protein BURPS668_A2988 [Burkholderia pseudomallei 668]
MTRGGDEGEQAVEGREAQVAQIGGVHPAILIDRFVATAGAWRRRAA